MLLRSAGLGKFGENNRWPIAVMRRAFGVGSNQETGLALGVAGVNPGPAQLPFEAMFSLAVRFLDGTSHRVELGCQGAYTC
jgi:hypothetical protein